MVAKMPAAAEKGLPDDGVSHKFKMMMPAGPVYKYDFSLALPLIYDLVEATRSRLAHLPATVVSYGHLGETGARSSPGPAGVLIADTSLI